MYVYAQLGISLSHFTGDQIHEGYRIQRNQLLPGDLVFFYAKKACPDTWASTSETTSSSTRRTRGTS